MLAPTRKMLFTVEDYHKMVDAGILTHQDRVELINGEILKMSPIKSQHAGIVNLLNENLIIQLYQKATILCQNPITLDQKSEPEPDLVIAKYKSNGYADRHPVVEEVIVVIEVADTTLHYDEKIKATLYANAGIKTYCLFDVKNTLVKLFTHPTATGYRAISILQKSETLIVEQLGLELSLGQIFK